MGKWFDVLPMTQVDHRLFVGGTAPAAELAKQNPAKYPLFFVFTKQWIMKKTPI